MFAVEPTSQYGNVDSVATFTCTGEAGNAKAGDPTVKWYNTIGDGTMVGFNWELITSLHTY